MPRRERGDEDYSAFMDPLAPPWAMRGLATLLVAIFVVASLCAAIIQLPETVTSPFVLVPVHAADPVRATRDGIIDRVNASAGQPVVQGDALFTIRSESQGDRASELDTLVSRRDGAREALTNEIDGYSSLRRADDAELRSLEGRVQSMLRQLALRREEHELTKQVAARYENLAERGLVSETALANYKLEEHQARRNLEVLSSSVDETRSAIEKLELEVESRAIDNREAVRELREEAERAEIRIAALQQQHRPSDGAVFSIPAPCSGTILRVQIQARGTFVQEGEVLGELACADEPLQAQLDISQGDIALLEPGQGIKLLYDAFPYQRYGVRFATLRWVSPASIDVDGHPVFRALADVAETEVFVNGKARSIKPGMRGKARIVIGRRTLLSYAFEPVQRLRESLMDAPTS